jgi:hypothetical protein
MTATKPHQSGNLVGIVWNRRNSDAFPHAVSEVHKVVLLDIRRVRGLKTDVSFLDQCADWRGIFCAFS